MNVTALSSKREKNNKTNKYNKNNLKILISQIKGKKGKKKKNLQISLKYIMCNNCAKKDEHQTKKFIFYIYLN